MNATQEVREQYKMAAQGYIEHINAKGKQRNVDFYAGRMPGLDVALSCLGVTSDEIREMYAECEEQVKDERANEDIGPGDVSYDEEGFVEQEELDAVERPVSQAQVDCQITLEHIQARFTSPATPADIQKAVQAFKDGFKEAGQIRW